MNREQSKPSSVASTRFLGAALLLLLAVGGVVWVVGPGCETGQRRDTRPVGASPVPTVADRDAPSSQPSPAPQASAPATQPATQPAAIELPEYLELVERLHESRAFQIEVRTDGSQRITLDTENVRRLRIDRRKLPANPRGSIAIRIDDQGIEWTPRVIEIELERSPSGRWSVRDR
ncbi:MAG: hypothetical protein AB7Q17_07895 [Phycisphaerae bacterium]